jgi:hypothetical protein
MIHTGPYVGKRFSNGAVAVDDLWQMFKPGNTTFRASSHEGTNFAIGGATTGSGNNLEVGTIPRPPLNGLYANKGNAWQLNHLESSTTFDPNTSLFTLWLYPNDTFDFNNNPLLSAGTYNGANSTPTTFNAIPALAVDNIVGSIQELATCGANPPQPRSAGSAEIQRLARASHRFNRQRQSPN